jgi:hypothetical protein
MLLNMTGPEIREYLAENNDEVMFADGFEDALIGTVSGACRQPVACYDYQKCVDILVKRDKMTEEEAEEYISFNVTGAYMGELTPLFVYDLRSEEAD